MPAQRPVGRNFGPDAIQPPPRDGKQEIRHDHRTKHQVRPDGESRVAVGVVVPVEMPAAKAVQPACKSASCVCTLAFGPVVASASVPSIAVIARSGRGLFQTFRECINVS